MKVNCADCGKEIIFTEGQYNFRSKRNKKGLFYCSNECRMKGHIKEDVRTIRLTCHKCGKDFTDELGKYEYNRRLKTLNEVGRVFCSRNCSALFMDTDPEIRKAVADKERGVSVPQRGRIGHIINEETRIKIGESNRIYNQGDGPRVELTCAQCNKTFHRLQWIYNRDMKVNKGRGPFCSRLCASIGHPVSKETIEKIRALQIGISRPQSGRTGHVVSEETRINISLANTGVPKKADWDIVDDAMKRLGKSRYAILRAPVPDSVFIEDGKIVAVEVEKKRWEAAIRRKMKSYKEHMNKWDKVILMWYTPDSKFVKKWILENGSWLASAS
jgi:hypothetical protein